MCSKFGSTLEARAAYYQHTAIGGERRERFVNCTSVCVLSLFTTTNSGEISDRTCSCFKSCRQKPQMGLNTSTGIITAAKLLADCTLDL